jgi:acyl-lipid omega-6 desaturase (Delta-12 desaturase)
MPYLALLLAMYLLLDVSVVGVVALAPLAAGFLLRTFVVFHDCTHGSLFETMRANRRLGTVLRPAHVHPVRELGSQPRGPPRHGG